MKTIKPVAMMAGLTIILLPLLVGNVWPASYHCDKAATKIEKMICADPELSKLDEDLAAAYKTALQNRELLSSYLAHHQADYIRQTQKEWLKKRNKCIDAACVKQAYETRLQRLNPQRPWYVHCVDLQPAANCGRESGKGYTVCEAYLQYLNTLNRMPVCEVAVPPFFQHPDWEELDVMKHIDWAYQAEIIARGNNDWFKKEYPDAATWKRKFLEEIKAGWIKPAMKKGTVSLTAGRYAGVYYPDVEEIEILAYTRSKKGCLDQVEGYYGRTRWTRIGYVHSRITGNPDRPLSKIRGSSMSSQAVMVLYKDKPYYVRAYGSGAEVPYGIGIYTFRNFLPSRQADQKYGVKKQCNFDVVNQKSKQVE